MTGPPLLFYDLGSPYAYLAVARAERVLGTPPELRPVLLGAIFAVRGHGSWSATPRREAGMAEGERRGAPFAHAAFRRAFAEGADLADPRVLADIAVAVGLDGTALGGAIAAPDVKDDLRARTEAAFDLGVRGVPTLAVGDRLLYGDDRLE